MNVLNDTSTRDGEQLCQIILKSIHNCRSLEVMIQTNSDGRTNACMHIHQTDIVTTMSCSPQSGLQKVSTKVSLPSLQDDLGQYFLPFVSFQHIKGTYYLMIYLVVKTECRMSKARGFLTFRSNQYSQRI